ncbi:hypothetical protein C4D60_Mb05t29710 [Musa balbisiana]|uniref:Uncharacterized protein n=1 Tax=Musa balbisiana TaxID=52838 RepID=A0A4S8JZR2_MUSBA|nr:hypothetical protein C4D60_Mb05t29710 [Musa balbisiana]
MTADYYYKSGIRICPITQYFVLLGLLKPSNSTAQPKALWTIRMVVSDAIAQGFASTKFYISMIALSTDVMDPFSWMTHLPSPERSRGGVSK